MTEIKDNEPVWGVLAGNLPEVEKWDLETAKWRLEDHCRALAQEGQSREDALQYLTTYARAGAADPEPLVKALPQLIEKHNAVFSQWEAHEELIDQHTPKTDKEIEAQSFLYAIPPAKENQEGMFPLGDVSLIGGPSGAGKTTWFLPVLEDIRQAKSVLGRTTNALDYRVLMHDRSLGAFFRTSRRLRLDEDAQNRVYRLTGAEQKMAAADFLGMYMERMRSDGEEVRIIFIEGLDMWTAGDVAKMADVSVFLDGLQRVAERYGVAVVGSVGNPKAKRGEEYQLQRDKLFGSVAWGRKTETIVGVQYADKEDDESTVRVITVLPRNGRSEIYYVDFKNGRLVDIEKPSHLAEEKENPLTKKTNALAQIREMVNGTTLTRTQLGMSKDTYSETMHSAMRQHLVTQMGNRYVVTGGRIPTN